MEYRRLGNSGLKLSLYSYGSWVTFANQVEVKLAKELMTYAYDNGINFFDNAEAYMMGDSEVVMGKVLKELAWSRDSYCVSSKVFWGGDKPTQRGLSNKHIVDACNAALRRLQVEYLDLYFCHRPDPNTPIEETVRAMHNLILQGKILYWGTSEWNAQQITEAHCIAKEYGLTPPTMEQPEYNFFQREKVEKDYLPLYDNFGLGTTIWSPLASGILTGKYKDGIPKESRLNLKNYEWLKNQFDNPEGRAKIDKTEKLKIIAQELDISVHHLALFWCAKNRNVSTIILGASRLDQLKDNLSIIDKSIDFTDELISKIEDIVKSKPRLDNVFE
ncbi:potassium channel beta subunit family protein [Candidatus Neomarinimicrobiota bacterium]